MENEQFGFYLKSAAHISNTEAKLLHFRKSVAAATAFGFCLSVTHRQTKNVVQSF